MDDRELLERAARAAGIRGADGIDKDGTHWWYNSTMDGHGRIWNPLQDDADVFRLMVDAEIVVASAYGEIMATHDEITAVTGPLGDDPYATARRAIVSAAANKEAP